MTRHICLNRLAAIIRTPRLFIQKIIFTGPVYSSSDSLSVFTRKLRVDSQALAEKIFMTGGSKNVDESRRVIAFDFCTVQILLNIKLLTKIKKIDMFEYENSI